MTANDYVFVEYEGRFFIVQRGVWKAKHHVEDRCIIEEIKEFLPASFQEVAESCFASYDDKGKPHNKKQNRKLLKDAGFEEVKW